MNLQQHPKKIIFTVTNDLNYDQRMIRICSTMVELGYEVWLVGRTKSDSKPLVTRSFQQKRLHCSAESGKMFYIQYWIKLFFFLLFQKTDAICAIDLDTIMPVYVASVLKRCKRVYDAHEIFTEIPELEYKPTEKKIWNWIANFSIPKFPIGYTVGNCCATYFKKHYNANYPVVTNATILKTYPPIAPTTPYLLYQGAVNKGRAFDQLIPAMQHIDIPLVICGDGSYYDEVKALIEQYNVGDKVQLKGYVPPDELIKYTQNATIGILLLDADSKNNIFSMANRLFDYMHHGVPQLSMDYPEYKAVNEQFEIALLMPATLTPDLIATKINLLLTDTVYYNRLKENSLAARHVYCWQNEAKKLDQIYKTLFLN